MAYRARSASGYDHACYPEDHRREGTYAWDTEWQRRDPSGMMQEKSDKVMPASAMDHDIIYATTQGPPPTATLPALPDPTVAAANLSVSKPALEFSRRGQRVGDIGWGCYTINQQESADHGVRDGHAALTMNLEKRNQFLKLPGDPCFDKRAGKHLTSRVGQVSRRPK
jgi:hypothetical protein